MKGDAAYQPGDRRFVGLHAIAIRVGTCRYLRGNSGLENPKAAPRDYLWVCYSSSRPVCRPGKADFRKAPFPQVAPQRAARRRGTPTVRVARTYEDGGGTSGESR